MRLEGGCALTAQRPQLEDELETMMNVYATQQDSKLNN